MKKNSILNNPNGYEFPFFQDYEVIPGGDKDNTWEKEIEDMLSDEAQKQ